MESIAALLLKQAQAERAAVAAQIGALTGVQESFDRRLDQAVESLAEIAQKLPNYAFAGGKQAVAALAGPALDDAAMKIAGAVEAITKVEKDRLAEIVASLGESATAVTAAQEQASRRWIGGAVTAMAAGFLFAILGAGWMVNDARAEREASRAAIADQQPRLDRLNAAFVQKKEELTQTLNEINRQIDDADKKLSALERKGARFETGKCADQNGKSHLCVAVDPNSPRYSINGDEGKPFYIVKGF